MSEGHAPDQTQATGRLLSLRWLTTTKIFQWPNVLWATVGLSLLLLLPSIFIGYFADDHIHRLAAQSPNGYMCMQGIDLFRFATGTASETNEALARGVFQWWALPELKLGFFRPISSILILFDHHVLGDRPVLHHIHSILWYLATVIGVGCIYNKVLRGKAAAIAMILFAVDDAHVQPSGWLANRNALVVAAFGFWALYWYIESQKNNNRTQQWLSIAALALSFLSGEAAFGIAAYFFAYTFVGQEGTISQKILKLTPYGLLGIVYLVFYFTGHYGTHGSGVYIHPTDSPVTWITNAIPRMIALGGALLFNVPIDIWLFSDAAAPVLVLVSAVLITLIVVMTKQVIPYLTAEEKKTYYWLTLGAILSMVPLASTLPSPRLLLLPSFGAFGVMAMVISKTIELTLTKFSTRLATVLWVLHFWLAMPLWLGQYNFFITLNSGLNTLAREMPVTNPKEQVVVTLIAPDPFIAMYAAATRSALGLEPIKRPYNLSMAPHDLKLTRTDQQSVEVEIIGGTILETSFEKLFRDPNFPMQDGYKAPLGPDCSVTVLATNHGKPSKFVFRYELGLNHPNIVFLEWRDHKIHSYTIPAVGETVVVKHSLA